MAECHTFPIREVRRAKERAAQAARLGFDQEPVGWTLDPSAVLNSFGCLHVKAGWKLLAYLWGDHLGGESRVVAVPAGFDPVGAELLPLGARAEVSPGEQPAQATEWGRPYVESPIDDAFSLPREARRRFMAAVEGDGSPWSHLCASLAVRQLIDYVASWHALYEHDWFEHVILAGWPPPRSALKEPVGALDGPQPSLWRPAVWVGRGSTTVRFYTYRPATAVDEGVWMHEDRYEAHGYDPEVTNTLIAAGAPGVICY